MDLRCVLPQPYVRNQFVYTHIRAARIRVQLRNSIYLRIQELLWI